MPNDSESEYFPNTSKSFREVPSDFQIKIVADLEVLCTGDKAARANRVLSGYMKGKLKYKQELKASNEKEMSMQYDSLSED